MDVSTSVQLEIVGRLLLAAALGALIGLERELRGYPAGIRTTALVTMGAALFTDAGRFLTSEDRVAANIVTGIGFLGAGLIFHEGATVKGITTAATIWTAAAIGLAIGMELYVTSVLAALVAVVLLELRVVTRRFDRWLGVGEREGESGSGTEDRQGDG